MQKSPQQAAFCEALTDTRDNILLDAKAGAGKTSALVMGAEATEGTDSLALAFNKDACTDLWEKMPSHVTCQTLNAFGFRAWRRHLGDDVIVEVEQDKVFKLTNEHAPRDIRFPVAKVVQMARDAGLVPGVTDTPFLADTDDAWKGLAFDAELERPDDQRLADFGREILSCSNDAAHKGTLDFADQLYLPVAFDIDVPQEALVFVDEAQDLNPMQHILVEKAVGERLVAAGDARQAIFCWRGAYSDSMDRLQEKFFMRTMPLSVCFRCGSRIVREAQREVPEIEPWDDAPQGSVDHMEDRELSPSRLARDDVVLCRKNAPLTKLAYKMIQNGYPVRMAGRDIGKGLVALLKKVSKARDPSRHTIHELRVKVDAWREQELLTARMMGRYSKLESINDKAESTLSILSELAHDEDGSAALETIDRVFRGGNSGPLLSTIHRAKGLEWNRVYWLYPGNTPLEYLVKEVEKQPDNAALRDLLQQEYNLRYVAKTRAKENLVYVYKGKSQNTDDDYQPDKVMGVKEAAR